MSTYTAKYGMGQRVAAISHEDLRYIVRCYPCSQTGKIKIGEEEFICPKCHGRAAHVQYGGEKWYVSEESEIGKISVIHINNIRNDGWYENKPNPRVEYMIFATGVGSGRVWDEELLFPSREEAQAECDRRNAPLPSDECESKDPIIDNYGRVL